MIVNTLGAASRHRFRGRRARPVKGEPGAEELELTRITVVLANGLQGTGEGKRWLQRVAADSDSIDAFLAGALRVVNKALHAHRIATQDPYIHELAPAKAAAARVGYGTGDELADGRWSEAIEVPRRDPKRRRAESLRPQERLAAALGGHEPVTVYETMLLRGRLDLDQGRVREAALQLRVGVESLLVELAPDAGPGQEEDLARLEQGRDELARAASAALRGELDDAAAARLGELLDVSERVLRRRRILSE